LQQAIKGISVAAITRYLLFILHLIFKRLHRKIDAFDPVVATTLSVPFVLAWPPWMFRRRGKPVPDGEIIALVMSPMRQLLRTANILMGFPGSCPASPFPSNAFLSSAIL
jgi:hypothetical protein